MPAWLKKLGLSWSQIKSLLETEGAKNKAYDSDVDGVFDLAAIPMGILKHFVTDYGAKIILRPNEFRSVVSGSATTDNKIYEYYLSTGTTAGSIARIWAKHGWPGTVPYSMHDDYETYLGILFHPNNSSNLADCIIWMILGRISDYSATSDASKHVGIKIDEGTIYGTVGDGTTEYTVDLGTPSFPTAIEMRYYPNDKVDYYVNGVYKDTISTLPASIPYFNDLHISISNKVDSNKVLYFYVAYLYQKR